MASNKAKASAEYLIKVCAIALGLMLLGELVGWLVTPERYDDPPPVTADAWISSDALARQDTAWMKQFVDEFCASYKARWTSYVYFKRLPFAGHLINVDSNGIRYTPQFANRATQGTPPVRIFMLGGSTMWGTCARDSGTIPSALSRIISSHADTSPCEVVNMGESGYVSTQAIIRLELELRRGNVPDIVILYDGVNDVFSAHQNNMAGLPQNEMHRATEFNLLKEQGRMRKLGLGDLWNRTVTAGLVNSIRSAMTGTPPTPPPPLSVAGDVVNMYLENLRIVDALSRQFGFHYEAYWQPVVFVRATHTPYEQKESQKMEYVRPLFLETYGRVKQDLLLENNPRFHNLSAIFDTISTPVYLDFCHISEFGNAIIARWMHDDIATRIKTESRKKASTIKTPPPYDRAGA
jgi:lysophospholipase L1-like esterase